MNHTLLHECAHTYRITRVFHKHQEGCHVRDKAAMQRDTIGNRGHTKLAHAIIDIVAVIVFFDAFRAFK